MVSRWVRVDDAMEEQEIHQMDEESANDLHSVMDLDTSKYGEKTPRLLGVIEENNNVLWDTIFFSDFIRSSELE